MLCNLWLHSHRRPGPGNCLRSHRESRRHLPHHASGCAAVIPVEVDLRASAVPLSSECLFSGGDDALATHFRRHVRLSSDVSPSPTRTRGPTITYSGATTKSQLQQQQPQHQRRSPNPAAARTQKKSELQQQQQWQQRQKLTDPRGSIVCRRL